MSNSKGRRYTLSLTLAALGIVYGDIGTSPLYALRECFNKAGGLAVTTANIYGIISLIFWALIFVISFKYLLFIMRADNEGEGGILALMESVIHYFKGRFYFVLLSLGLFGAALLYGDGIITPAISVLSAVEGLKVATPVFKPYILPITLAILFGLFLFQKRGTARVGNIFGPLMLIWFTVLGVLGISSILKSPGVLYALNPWYSYQFFMLHSWQGVVVLGAVFLVVTGGEALYADLGHFNITSIRMGWFGIVLPSLMLNYLGQGALLLRDPLAVENPFYHLPPGWALYPMVILSTIATIIASQAVISGVFSLTYQAVNLNLFPRLNIIHTSSKEKGQVYIPFMNWIMFVATALLVLGFKDSSNLAGAYGVAVSTTMVITSLLAFLVMIKLWRWNRYVALLLTAIFLAVDFSFFGSNLLKISEGGWLPLFIAGFLYLLMSTWRKGRNVLGKIFRKENATLDDQLQQMDWDKKDIIEGTAVYLSTNPNHLPSALHLNYDYNKILHRCVVILTYMYLPVPRVNDNQRLKIKKLIPPFSSVIVQVGFMESVKIPHLLPKLEREIADFDTTQITYIIGTKHLMPVDNREMPKWRKNLFVFLQKNDVHVTTYFGLPEKSVMEIGSHIAF